MDYVDEMFIFTLRVMEAQIFHLFFDKLIVAKKNYFPLVYLCPIKKMPSSILHN